MNLEAVNNQEPVTALRFLGSRYLLAGVGSFLKTYDWKSGRLVNKRQIFPINKVHGIIGTENGSRAIAWGGNNLAFISGFDDLRVDNVYTCKDRIVGASVLKESLLFVLTAHNEVLELQLPTMDVRKIHKCAERSILYSGSLFLSEDRCFVAAGTVFGGVVVWDLTTDTIHNNLGAHEGSIFDVAWSRDGRYIASCSDDRALIVSDVKTGQPIAYGWGHLSRIWKVKFITNDCIISISEDCTARVWKLHGDKLECTRIMTGHQGRSIWSLDIVDNVVATGGGDGKIMLWDLDHTDSTTERWDISTVFDAPVRSCSINELSGAIVVTSTDGYVHLKLAGTNKWSRQGDRLGPVPVAKSHGGVFYVMSSDGSGMSLNETGEVKFTFTVPYKVLDFFVLSDQKLLVVPTPPSTKLLLVTLTPEESETKVLYTEVNQRPGLGVVTCATLTDNNSVCIGTRNGGLALYNDTTADAEVVLPASLGSKTDAITSLKVIRSENADPYIIATARSSDYGVFSLADLTRMFKNRGRKRGSIEGFDKNKQGLIFWGFQKDLFLAWNATLAFEIAAVDCGGSHRAWSCSASSASPLFPAGCAGLTFCYVRNAELIVQSICATSAKFEHPLLQYGTHGREIRGMEICPTNSKLLATASEDTTVNFGWIDYELANVRGVCSVNDGHVSGIQCLHWQPDGKYLFTGAGNGELVMWKVYTKGEAIFANEVSRMPTKSSKIKELRIMDCSILDELVAVAYSDSSFRLWRLREYAPDKFTWDMLLEQTYEERCLLNIDLIPWHGTHWLIISSTDGYVVLYELLKSTTHVAEMRLRKRLHQSGIRCSEVIRKDDSLNYYSGGDDNAICGVRLNYDGKEVSAEDIFSVVDAHSSAVTSIKFMEEPNILAITGSDQKITLWRPNGQRLGGLFTDVADTDVMVTDGSSHIIAGGIGLSFFELKS